jgi:hypothetical protein
VALRLLTPSHAGNLAADAADGNKAQPEGRHGEPLDLTPQRSHAQRYRGLVRTVECLLGLRPGRALAKNASAPESARGQPRRMLQPLQAASRPHPNGLSARLPGQRQGASQRPNDAKFGLLGGKGPI